MAEPAVMVEVVKAAGSFLVATKNMVFSKRSMAALASLCALGAFAPARWWDCMGMVKSNAFCKEHHEYLVLGCCVAALTFVWLVVQVVWNKKAKERRFDKTMRSLSDVEVQALCNAYYNRGKYSIPSCAAELQSLNELQLIVVPKEPGNFGGQEFVLRPEVTAYLKDKNNYFTKRGIKPQKPEEPGLPFCAVL